jgi:lipopolysaccharide exporter
MILFALLYFLSPQVADFFDDTRVVPIIRVIAISILLSGFANIGIVLFRKELDFKKQFIYETLSNSADIVISIALALWLRTVWALVIGGVAGHIMRLILSYGLHPWRPALSFDAVKFREMFTFGKWMLAAGILHFVITKADDLFVGKYFGVAALGLYQMAYLLSNVTTTDLTHTISQIAFPAYSKIQNDPSTLVNVYLKVLRGVAFISVSVAFFLFAFASELVELLLGGQWVAMAPVLEVLAFAGLARSIQSTAVPVFLAMGRPKIHTEINIIRAVVLFCLIYPFATTWGMLGVAYAVLTSCVVSVLAVSLRIPTVINVRVSQFYMSIFVPVLTAATSLVLMMLVKQTGVESGPVRLLFLLLFGASVYLALSIAADRRLKYGMRETVQEAWQHFGIGKKMLLQKAGKQP